MAERLTGVKLQFTVFGRPRPAGSKRSLVPLDRRGQPYRRKTGGVVVCTVDDCENLKQWQAHVSIAARKAMTAAGLSGPTWEVVRLDCVFYLQRPKNHFGTGRNAWKLRDGAPGRHGVKSDRSKLLRAVEDAITGIVFVDDAQIDSGETAKHWTTSGDRVEITVRWEQLSLLV